MHWNVIIGLVNKFNMNGKKFLQENDLDFQRMLNKSSATEVRKLGTKRS